MNRNTGLVAGLVAVVALVGYSNRSNRSPESQLNTQPEKSQAASAKAQSTSEERTSAASMASVTCAEIRKRLARFVDEDPRARRAESWMLPDSCYENGESPVGPERVRVFRDVQFAIALVPNPVSTHLPLLFDRLVEAIQQAVQDDGYSYDASWFPWDTTKEELAP
jgi:hypothetical protein